MGVCWWWLRSPGYNSRLAALVSRSGYVYYTGDDVGCDGYGVCLVVVVLL
ncbi:MAG: hypothetical protein IKR85_10560 [Clostridia bacterium]|nr:hypothetical protein [Clostridia bacterium]